MGRHFRSFDMQQKNHRSISLLLFWKCFLLKNVCKIKKRKKPDQNLKKKRKTFFYIYGALRVNPRVCSDGGRAGGQHRVYRRHEWRLSDCRDGVIYTAAGQVRAPHSAVTRPTGQWPATPCGRHSPRSLAIRVNASFWQSPWAPSQLLSLLSDENVRPPPPLGTGSTSLKLLHGSTIATEARIRAPFLKRETALIHDLRFLPISIIESGVS